MYIVYAKSKSMENELNCRHMQIMQEVKEEENK